MYNITRQEAAKKLKVSTRSIDRYVKSGKIRSKKEGKIIYLHENDVANIAGETPSNKTNVIIEEQKSEKNISREANTQNMVDASSGATLEKIYLDMKSEITKKDTLIQDLSLRLGQAQEIAKNSVSLVEFKKSQFLLEESKGYMSKELKSSQEEANILKQKLRYEKNTNYLLMLFCVFMVIILGILWFMNI